MTTLLHSTEKSKSYFFAFILSAQLSQQGDSEMISPDLLPKGGRAASVAHALINSHYRKSPAAAAIYTELWNYRAYSPRKLCWAFAQQGSIFLYRCHQVFPMF